jgi:hypothetical protein
LGLDLGPPDRATVVLPVSFSLSGHCFGAYVGWRVHEVERSGIYNIDDERSQQRGAAGSRLWTHHVVLAQDGVVV